MLYSFLFRRIFSKSGPGHIFNAVDHSTHLLKDQSHLSGASSSWACPVATIPKTTLAVHLRIQEIKHECYADLLLCSTCSPGCASCTPCRGHFRDEKKAFADESQVITHPPFRLELMSQGLLSTIALSMTVHNLYYSGILSKRFFRMVTTVFTSG